MVEYMGSNERIGMIVLSFIIALFVTVGIAFFQKQANKELHKILVFQKYVIVYLAVCVGFLFFFVVSSHLFFKTDKRLQEVEHAKLQAVAEEFHVDPKEVKLKEKNIPDFYYRSEKRIYEAKVKGEIFEVVLGYNDYKEYRVVKIAKVIKEEKY